MKKVKFYLIADFEKDFIKHILNATVILILSEAVLIPALLICSVHFLKSACMVGIGYAILLIFVFCFSIYQSTRCIKSIFKIIEKESRFEK